jgi:hypothetical protein
MRAWYETNLVKATFLKVGLISFRKVPKAVKFQEWEALRRGGLGREALENFPFARNLYGNKKRLVDLSGSKLCKKYAACT